MVNQVPYIPYIFFHKIDNRLVCPINEKHIKSSNFRLNALAGLGFKLSSGVLSLSI